MAVGGNLGSRTLGIQHARTRIRDVPEDSAFFLREALHGFHQVRNQVRTALELDVDFRPSRLYALIFGDHLVLGAHIATEHHDHGKNEHTEHSQYS